MNSYKQIFKLLKSSYGIFIYVIIYFMIMIFMIGANSSNIVNQNAKTYGTISVELKNEDQFSTGLKDYLKKFYKIEEIKDYKYAINTTYSVGHVKIEDIDNVEVTLASAIVPLKLHVNQYINSIKQNDPTLLLRRVETEVVESKGVLGLKEFFQSYALLIFGISGMFVISFIKPLMSKETIEKVRLSSTSMTKYITSIFLGLFTIMLVITLLASGFAMIVLGASISQIIWPVVNSMLYFGISLMILFMVFAITSNEDVIMVISNALGVLLVMISGSFFPFEYIPRPIQIVAKLLPTYYYNQLVSGFDLNFVLIQCAFLIALSLATVNILKYNKQR